MIYYRARYFDPNQIRFTQRDPLGFRAGINRYTYVGNNPVNLTDPTGLNAQNPLSIQFASQNSSYYSSNPGSTGLGSQSANPFSSSTFTGQNYQVADASSSRNSYYFPNTAGLTPGTPEYSLANSLTQIYNSAINAVNSVTGSNAITSSNDSQSQTYYHYSASPPESFVNGLISGSYATTAPNYNSYEAAEYLGIRPPLPTLLYPVTMIQH